MNVSETILEFNVIKQQLCSHALSDEAKERLSALAPLLSEREVRLKTSETTDARRILDHAGAPPLSAIRGIRALLTLSEKGAMLTPGQLQEAAAFFASCGRMKAYLKRAQSLDVNLAYTGDSISDLSDLKEQIDSSVQNGAVLSSASPALRDIRRKLEAIDGQIRKKLDDLLRSKKNLFTDGFVSIRNGRYVLPVRKECKNQVAGTVVGISGSGGTVFIEPAAVSRLLGETHTLQIEEENEISRILYALTAAVDSRAAEIRVNIEAMAALDAAFAKAKLSAELSAVPAVLADGKTLELQKGRHPLLPRGRCVPLDFSASGEVRGVVITGPNTGGKTVALKTVGLLSMMAQSGLHVPAERFRFPMTDRILCDIGDGQSISENLSTFSAHLTNIIEILGKASEDSLVLLDELGSGTDPAEGMGIAVAVLEELRQRNCLFLVTTHYPEVKDYAARSGGIVNARMAFDQESLSPLYRLEIGEAGESCALSIAKRLGFPAHLLQRAYEAAYADGPKERVKPAFSCDPGPEFPAAPRTPGPKILREKPERTPIGPGFEIGDSVEVLPGKTLGIVFAPADEKGMVGVQVKGEKQRINHKRLSLKVKAAELYPPDYDFSILFDTVKARKARHQMEKRHLPGVAIEIEPPK